jgi:D-glycero-D-manno-heptose 1,7-bisphosphate phosphatase
VSARRAAVFLDRDGTLNREVDYLSHPSELELLPGAAEAVAKLNRAGWAVIVVTNQSGIARGKLDEPMLSRIHAQLDTLLAEHGAHIDAYYACPHHPDHGEPPYRATCACRKPLPGMLLSAAEEHQLDLKASWMVGDSLRDVQAGEAAETRSILVATGKPDRLTEESPRVSSADDLAQAVERILAES